MLYLELRDISNNKYNSGIESQLKWHRLRPPLLLFVTSAEPFVTLGSATGFIPVRIGFRIVELFSDGLYSSPNKAIEELVSNSFDAGARNVHVVLSPDRTTAESIIAVIDDGVSMDESGLRQHWLIGDSNKRRPDLDKPLGRKQIGKFGIGKLATFVLASHFTHICKRDGNTTPSPWTTPRSPRRQVGLRLSRNRTPAARTHRDTSASCPSANSSRN